MNLWGEGFDGLNYGRFYTSVYEKQYDRSGWIRKSCEESLLERYPGLLPATVT
jgi:hypothetical protein